MIYNKEHKYKLEKVKLEESYCSLAEIFPHDMEKVNTTDWFWMVTILGSDITYAPSASIVKAFKNCSGDVRIHNDTVVEIDFKTTFNEVEDLIEDFAEEFL